MAKSLKNFIVGIGLDAGKFKEGVANVNSSLNAMRSTAIRTGGRFAAAIGAIGASAITTARDVDDLSMKMQYTDVNPQFAYDFGHAVARMGGDAKTAQSEILEMQKALNAFQREGDRTKLEQVAIVGIDPSSLFNMQNDLETFQKNLANITKGASRKQKLRLQEIFGLDDATMRLLEKGGQGVKLEMEVSQSLTGSIEPLTEQSRELVAEWEKIKQSATGFGNELAQNSIPAVTDLLKKAGEVGTEVAGWYRSARDTTSTFTGDFVEKRKEYKEASRIKILDRFFRSTDEQLEKDSVITFEQAAQWRKDNPQEQPEPPKWEQPEPPKWEQPEPPKWEQPEPPKWEQPEPPKWEQPEPPKWEQPLISVNREALITPPPQPQPLQIDLKEFTGKLQSQNSQPIQVNNTTAITVELDGRKVGESVTNYQETQNYIYEQGLMTTTDR